MSGAPPGAIGSRRLSRVQPAAVAVAAVLLILGYLVLVPLGFLLWETFSGDDGPGLGAFSRAYGETGMTSLVVTSLAFSSGSAAVALVVGTLLAYLHARTDAPFKPLLLVASLVPLIIPGILYAVAWILLASPRIGVLSDIVDPLPGSSFFNVFSLQGMVWVEGLHLSPVAFLLMSSAFRCMDPALEESALVCGAGRASVLRRITLPVVRPAVVATLLVVGIRAVEGFEVPALLGLPGGVHVFTSRIFHVLSRHPADFGAAGALSLSLLVVATALVLANLRLGRRDWQFQVLTGRGPRSGRVRLGRWRPVAGAVIVGYFAIAVAAPLGILVYASLQPFYRAPSFDLFDSATFENYRNLVEIPRVGRALRNSLLLGAGSATAVMAITAVGAWLIVRTRVRGRWLIDAISFVPLVMPGLVLGLSLSFVYLRLPVPVYGTLVILLIGYCTRFLPYGIRYASASMRLVSKELEDSARVAGAGWWPTFRRVVAPLLGPGLLAGWLAIVVVSLRELSLSLLLYSPGSEVFPVVLWEELENGNFPGLAAIGVALVVILSVLVAVAYRVGSRLIVPATD